MRCRTHLRRWVLSEKYFSGSTFSWRRNLRSTRCSSGFLHPCSNNIPTQHLTIFPRSFSTSPPGETKDCNSSIANKKLRTANPDSNDLNDVGSRSELCGTTPESPVLEAARKGRTVMSLLEKRNFSNINNVQNQECRRQSLKQATEALLCGTNATALLAENIIEIQERRKSTKVGERDSDPASACLSELHKTFLNLAQDLLNCVDPDREDASLAASTDQGGARSVGPVSVPPDHQQLVELVVTLFYRAHQLSLSFTWPLYQRFVIVLAKQPKMLPTRSRGELIWHTYQWSQIALGTSIDTGNNQDGHVVDINWFRPAILELAYHQHLTDLCYLLRNILYPIILTEHTPKKIRRRRRSNKYTAIALVEDTHELANHRHRCLDEELVRDLLTIMEHHDVFPSLWNNLKNPSVLEQDILEILFLMERSIWMLFDYDPEADLRNVERNKPQRSRGKMDTMQRTSLRDAIQVLLHTCRQNHPTGSHMKEFKKLENEKYETKHDKAIIDTAQLLQDFKDILEVENDGDFDSEDSEQEYVDAVTLAAMLLDHRLPGVSRDLEVRAKRMGDRIVLEVPGVGHPDVLTSYYSDLDYLGDSDEIDMLYSREEGYHDDIPDVASQIFQHNGHRNLRYRPDFEVEIYSSLHYSPDDDWDES